MKRLQASLPQRFNRFYSFISPDYPFDALYVLNLDKRRHDRWPHILKQLEQAGLPIPNEDSDQSVSRVSGVDGETLDIHQLHQTGIISDLALERFHLPLQDKLYGMDLTPGGLGCALTHRHVWNRISEQHQQCALILEDDVEFHPSIRRLFLERWSQVPSDWQLVYLGGVDLLKTGKPLRPLQQPGIRYAYRGQRELTAYVLHVESAKRALELTKCLTWQIDTHLCEHTCYDIKAKDDRIVDPLSYVFQPSLAIQLSQFGTNVQKSVEPNPKMIDTFRRMHEFVGKGSSIR